MSAIRGCVDMSYFDECCGTCKWHEHDNWDDEWVCSNTSSDCYGVNTEYRDSCTNYEERL